MYGFLIRLGSWLLTKVGMAILILVGSLAAMGLWLYANDQVDQETRRLEHLDTLRAMQVSLAEEKAAALSHLQELRASAAVQQERIAQAQDIITQLNALKSWWEEWFGDADQQQANADQLTRLNGLVAEAESELQVLTRQVGQGEIELEALDFKIGAVERELVQAEQSENAVAHYLKDAWERAHIYILVILLVFFLGPSVVKVFAYFLIAPWLSRGKPIRFAEGYTALPHVRPSHVSTNVTLWQGEVLRVKENYLQSSDDRLNRQTRFVFDWSIPFTSLACGLTELVELRNGMAGERAVVTLSHGDDPHTELSVIEVPEGASIILRPSFLVGVITKGKEKEEIGVVSEDDDKVKIRRRWTLFRWQAWITLQFRFFEFVGPCRLVVAGSRGVRGEILRLEREGVRPARRTNQLATIGFTPNLDYLPVRAETFWGYYRNMNPLFDDLFAGEGLFVLQETARDQGGKVRRFWGTVWNSVLKVFGI